MLAIDLAARAIARIVLSGALFLAVGLSGCGGGGGGGGGGGSSGGGNNGGITGGSGGFTLSSTQLAFAGIKGMPAPTEKRIQLRVTGSKVAYVGAAYREGVTPPTWLGVGIVGTTPDFEVVLVITSTDLTEGDYSTTLSVGTADSEGNILSSQDIRIQYSIRELALVTGGITHSELVYGNSDATRDDVVHVQAPAGKSFTVHSDVPWMTTDASPRVGPQDVPVHLSAEGLAVGTHTGTLTVTTSGLEDHPQDWTVDLVVRAPQLTISDSVAIGDDGRSLAGSSLVLSLETGTRSYPVQLTKITQTGGDWMRLSATSGQVGATPLEFAVDADRGAVRGGSYTGTIGVTIDVNGLVFHRDVPVYFGKELERLFTGSEGIGLAKLPSRAQLARTIPVTTTLNRPGVAWTAASDESWLTVTPSGVTGQSVVLTANPTGLAAGQTHFATVQLTSTDPGLELQNPTIRVGLWVGAQDPVELHLPADVSRIVTSPVEPIAYVHSTTATSIDVYNLYTGAKVRTLEPISSGQGGSQLEGMAMNADGSELYVADYTGLRIMVVDPVAGTLLRSYPTFTTALHYAPSALLFARTDGLPTLITDHSAYDAETGAVLAAFFTFSAAQDVSDDGRYLYGLDAGIGPSNVRSIRLERTGPAGESLVGTEVGEAEAGSNGHDVAVSSDGSRVITAAETPSVYTVFSAPDLLPSGTLAGVADPSNVEVSAADGRIATGSDSPSAPADIAVYSPALALRGSLACGGSLLPSSVQFSADGLRLTCIGTTGVEADGALGIFDVP